MDISWQQYFYIGADGENQIGVYLEDAPDKHWYSMIDFNETAVEAGKRWYQLRSAIT